MSSSSGAPAAPPTGAPAPSGAPTSGTPDAVSRRTLPKKQRILWDSDAATRGGKTSISVLLDWLTVPLNYTRWRAGKSQFGETREALCSEIKAEMRRNGIVHRENANIRTQISELERSYDAAVAWLMQSGYDGKIPDFAAMAAKALPVGVDTNVDSNNPIEAYVLRMCRYFHVLDAVMRQPAAAAAALASTAFSASTTASTSQSPSGAAIARKAPRNPRVPKKKKEVVAGGEHEPQQEDVSASGTETSSEASGDKAVETTTPVVAAEETDKAPLPAIITLANRATERRQPPLVSSQKRTFISSPRAGVPISATNSMITPVLIAPALHQNTSAQPEPRQSPAVAPTTSSPMSSEPTQRLQFHDAREERDRKRFCMDEEKNRLECEKLRLEVQTARLKLQVERVRARQQLAEAGLSHAEIDGMVEI